MFRGLAQLFDDMAIQTMLRSLSKEVAISMKSQAMPAKWQTSWHGKRYPAQYGRANYTSIVTTTCERGKILT